MRYLIPAGAVLLLAFLGQSEGAGDKKDDSPPWAHVTVGGEIRDLIEMRAKVNVLALLDRDLPMAVVASQWRGPLPRRALDAKGVALIRSMQVGEASWVVAMLDETDKDLDKVLPKLKAPEKGGLRVVLDGMLAASTKDPFVAHANGWGTMRVVEKDAATAPAMGEVVVMGLPLPGKYELSKGKFTSLAIQNGSSPILVTGKDVEQVAEVKGRLHVAGKLLISKQGPLVVDAKSIEIDPPKGKQTGVK